MKHMETDKNQDDILKKVLGPAYGDWEYLDETTKLLFLNTSFSVAAHLYHGNIDTIEKFSRRVNLLEWRVAHIECNNGFIDKYLPSEESSACIAVTPDKWEKAIDFYMRYDSVDVDTLSFLRHMAHRCKDGWILEPDILEARRAMALIAGYDDRQVRLTREKRIYFMAWIAKLWEKYVKRAPLEKME